jgi:hypothetical protein
MSYSNFNTFKLFQNVGINRSGDYMVSMKPNDNNISFHSSNSIDYNNVDIMSIKNIINKKQNEDLNLSSLNGTTINPVITINNNHSDCRIMTNLNVSGNLNVLNDEMIRTTGIGSFGSITTAGQASFGSIITQGIVGINTTPQSGVYLTVNGDATNDTTMDIINCKHGLYIKTTDYTISGTDMGSYKIPQGGNSSHGADGAWPLRALGGNNNGLSVRDFGYVAIGDGAHIPLCPLDVSWAPTTYIHQTGKAYWPTGAVNHSAYNRSLSARFTGVVWSQGSGFAVTSDSRIKTNIVDVPDNIALEQLRSIPCRYYEYIDKYELGTDKTIGFIAQEVESILPMAIVKRTEFIPNVYKIINCTWTSVVDKFSMSSIDLPSVSGIVYKFYVSNETNAIDEKQIILTGNSDNTFTFDAQYNTVFCYGNRVDDLKTVIKDKIFALNFSASQELDRIQQTHITEIASLKTENQQQQTKINTLETEVSTLKTENQQQQTKINTLETEVSTLKTENAELKSIIDKLKTANSFEEFKQTFL